MSPLPMVVVIGGPTASGKSALAVHVATSADDGIPGEIVCADSRQIYAGVAIAAAGPTDDERAALPHHLYGAFDPATTTVSAGSFMLAADAALVAIRSRGHRAIVVGGTGLYVRSLRLGLDVQSDGDPERRARLQQRFHAHGLAPLVDELRRRDPNVDARGIDLHNPVRVMRAIEILDDGGDLASRSLTAWLQRPPRTLVADAAWWQKSPSIHDIERAIEARTRQMLASGLVEESRALADRLPADHALLSTIGTAEALALHRGELDVEGAVAAITTRTRQYARRQRTWFRREPWWTSAPG
jgi:tRNA dimethylallyltransferase